MSATTVAISRAPNAISPSRSIPTAGASAPEVLVEEVIDAFAQRYDVQVETVSATEEVMFFPLPRPLRQTEAAE